MLSGRQANPNTWDGLCEFVQHFEFERRCLGGAAFLPVFVWTDEGSPVDLWRRVHGPRLSTGSDRSDAARRECASQPLEQVFLRGFRAAK